MLLDDNEPVGGPQNWSAGLSARHLPGHAVPPGRHADPAPEAAGRHHRRAAAQQARFPEGAERSATPPSKPDDTELEARMRSYELAYQMQSAAPEAVDLTTNPKPPRSCTAWTSRTRSFGTQLPAGPPAGRARRALRRTLLRRRQRLGRAQRHRRQSHASGAAPSDKPIAGLLADLKARGLLDDTLVVWGGEFGRTPFNEKGNGRDHNPWGFTMWMAGGGVKAGRHRHHRRNRPARGRTALSRPRHPRLDPVAAGPGSSDADYCTTAAPNARRSWADR